MTHSVFGRAGVEMATGAMMVLASIIDTFVFWFVFVSENCLLDFSWISISIFRVCKSEIVCVIVYINAMMIIIR